MEHKNIIVMKVGPHSGMGLSEIVESKKEEEKGNGVHYWGYSGVFCHPDKVQSFCEENQPVSLVLIETKSTYTSSIGFITEYSEDNKTYQKFISPVQLQGAQYSFVAKNIREMKHFNIDNYITVGGKNDGKPLTEHLKFRVNKSFARCKEQPELKKETNVTVLIADLVYPYAVWLKDETK